MAVQKRVVRLMMAVFLACAALPAFAQLSPEAQRAIAWGKEAAQNKNYELAISFFKMAQAAAPNAPEIYGYLGLTESKISGRELRAIAWYGAYLAANPRAGNAAAVNNAIAELMKTSENNISLLMKTWETAVASMPDSADRGPHTNGWRRDFAWSNVGTWYASYGTIEDARRIANAINAVPDPYMAGGVFVAIIDTQLKAGDTAGAKRTLKSIRDGGVLFPGVPSSKEIAKDKFDHAEQLRKDDEVTAGAVVSDWTQLFVAGAPPGLDGEMFTDLAASMHPKSSDSADLLKSGYGAPWIMVEQLSYVAYNLGSMQKKIKRMLKVQAAQQVTQ
jgi:tetratricopeptide (TPR) repeat protein